MSKIRLNKININIRRFKKMRRPVKKMIVFVGLALCALILIILMIYFWRFRNFAVDVSNTEENTLVYSYYSVDGNVLKCASDTASLVNHQNEALWSLEYHMTDPKVDSCDDNIIIYDKNGSTIILCDGDGKVSEFRTEFQIIKAEVSKSGTVAALLDDGSTAEIDYFDADGELIAAVRTTMTSNGYPMDIALSDDGLVIGVSYLNFSQGSTVSDVVFYGFNSTGREASDNIIGRYSFENEIIPEIAYTDSGRFTSFGTDTISVYMTDNTVRKTMDIAAEDEISSIFADDKYFGYIMKGNDNTGYEIVVYNSNGNEKTRINTEFSYTSADVFEDRIVLYNRSQLAVYSTSGVLKFEGDMNCLIREIRSFGGNRYAMAATDGYYVIRLY